MKPTFEQRLLDIERMLSLEAGEWGLTVADHLGSLHGFRKPMIDGPCET